MKNLLTVTFIVTLLYACGGEFKHQDNSSADNAPTTEQSTKQHAAVAADEAKNKQATATDKETLEQVVIESKTDSQIKMVMGLARSMY